MYDEIINMYYDTIFKYCYSRLNFSRTAAEDCTQEVFFLLYKKIKTIRLSDNIKLWLYRTADLEIKSYMRKHTVTLSIDECSDEQMISETDFSECSNNILNILENDERQLLTDYYNGMEKEKVAQSKNISVNALYIRIHRIKLKLINAMNSKKNY